MYKHSEQKEVLELLKAIDHKISNLEMRIENLSVTKEDSPPSEPKREEADDEQECRIAHKEWDDSMKDLSQMQYELSHELTSGIERLKKMINRSEKIVLDSKKQS